MRQSDRRDLALVLVGSSQFIIILDSTIVNIALPQIAGDLDMSSVGLSWVVNAFTLGFGGFLLLGGRLADVLGARRVFIAGSLGLAVSSIGAGLAPTTACLVIARAVQGLAAAAIAPAGLALLTALFPAGAERNRALGIWGALGAAGAPIGSLGGGLLTAGMGWRSIFLINVPFALLAALLAVRAIQPDSSRPRRVSVDYLGAITVSTGLVLVIYALTSAQSRGWEGSLATLIAGILLIVAFTAVERRADEPLLTLRLFNNRNLTVAMIVGGFHGMALLSMFFFITLYLQVVLGYTPLEAGLAYLPFGLVMVAGGRLAGGAADRLGLRFTMVLGLLLGAVSLGLFARAPLEGNYLAHVLVPSLLAGLALPLVWVGMTIAAFLGVRESERGLAGGMISTAPEIGAALGLALLVAIAGARKAAIALNGPEAALAGFQAAFLAGAGLAALGAVVAATLYRVERAG